MKQTHPKQQTLNPFMVSKHDDSRQPQCQALCPSPLNPAPQSQILTPSNHIQIKLTKDNYLSWKTIILPYINGNNILNHIDGTLTAPPPLISSTTTPPSKSQIQCILIGLTSSRDVWITLEKMFSSKSRARIMQTQYNLATLKKGNLSISDYFQKAKGFADLLSSIGQPLGLTETTSYILVGLLSEYESLVTTLNTRLEDCSLDELYDHLLTHELRLE